MQPFVMVIDHSMTVRKILEVTFERAGWPVRTFADGVQAMRALEQEEVPVPEALVIDVGLPKLNGYAVARAFRRQPTCRQCIILFLSGQDGVFDRLRRRLAGGHASLTKPFQPAEVLHILETLLSRTQQDQHLG